MSVQNLQAYGMFWVEFFVLCFTCFHLIHQRQVLILRSIRRYWRPRQRKSNLLHSYVYSLPTLTWCKLYNRACTTPPPLRYVVTGSGNGASWFFFVIVTLILWLLLGLGVEVKCSNEIDIRIQQRNGRKTLTTVQGLPAEIDQKRLLKAFKKVCLCYDALH